MSAAPVYLRCWPVHDKCSIRGHYADGSTDGSPKNVGWITSCITLHLWYIDIHLMLSKQLQVVVLLFILAEHNNVIKVHKHRTATVTSSIFFMISWSVSGAVINLTAKAGPNALMQLDWKITLSYHNYTGVNCFRPVYLYTTEWAAGGGALLISHDTLWTRDHDSSCLSNGLTELSQVSQSLHPNSNRPVGAVSAVGTLLR